MHFDRRLWALTAGSRATLFTAVLMGLLAATSGALALALLGVLLSRVVEGAVLEDVWVLPVGVLAFFALRSLFHYLKDSIAYACASRIQISLRERLFARLLELGPAHTGHARSGRLAIALVDSVEILEGFFGRFLVQLFIAGLTPVILFAAVAFIDPLVALVILVFGALALMGPLSLRRLYQDAALQRRTTWSDLAAEFIDSVQGLGTLKAFGQGKARVEWFARVAATVYASTMYITAVNMASGSMSTMFALLGGALAFSVTAWQVAHGTLSPTALLVVLFLALEMYRPIRDLNAMLHGGLMGIAAADDVEALMTAPVIVHERPTSAATGRATVAFDGVTHFYPDRAVPALSDLTLRVSAGERIGIVGQSGAGKSTLLWLLLRLYDPQQGRVSVGGVDVREMSFADLRSQIAVVPQDPYLFHGTVAENLRIARPDADQAQLEAAAQAANAHDFIARLPRGYDTIVGERGARLSGGERQRLAIARAVLRDAPILVLDEALSSVDARNEEVIVGAIRRLIEGRTTLIIAHRLSSIIATDRIVVLEGGRVVQMGTHADLIARGDGPYTRLMSDQARESEAALIGVEEDADATREPDEMTVAALAPLSASRRSDAFGEIHRLVQFIRGHRRKLVMVLGMALFPVVLAISWGLAASVAFAALRDGTDPTIALAILLGLGPLTALIGFLDAYAAHDFAFKLLQHLRVDLLRKLEQIAPAYLTTRRSGDLLGTATQDVELVEIFYAHTVAPIFVLIVPVTIVVALAIADLRLGLVLAPFILLAASVVLFGRDHTHQLGIKARRQLGELNAFVVESLQGMRDVFALDAAMERRKGFSALARTYAPIRLSFNRARALQTVFVDAVVGSAAVAVAITAIGLVREGRLEATALPLVVTAAIGSFLSVSMLAGAGRQMTETLAAAQRLSLVRDEPVPVVDGPYPVPPTRPKEVRFEDVRFTYPGSDDPALGGVTFRLAPGRTTALVGPSGAGKSTIAHLLMRFWDPTSGTITLDGTPLSAFELDSLRETVSLVSQDTYLFNTTIKENLLIARPDATSAQLASAVSRSGLEELIGELPDGLGTKVGERGLQLSGGQRQRIAIARAFLKEAPILVLDEATSHLDAVNESLIRSALLELASDRTTLVIAHRLSTVRSADQILVLERGRIVQSGTHEQLARSAGLYAVLVSAQVRAGRAVAG